MLDSRAFQVTELSRYFGVPPSLMYDAETATSSVTAEQEAIKWVTLDLHTLWLAPTEQRIAKELTPGGVDVKYSVDTLMRGDSAARAQFYQVMRQVGAFCANDIRDREDMGPVEGGSTFLQPLNMAPLGTPPVQMGTTKGGKALGQAPDNAVPLKLAAVSSRDELDRMIRYLSELRDAQIESAVNGSGG
jgi:hypothetical protein